MNARKCYWKVSVAAALILSSAALVAADDQRVTLTRAIPDDVFFCVVQCRNPERDFLDKYWGDVLHALQESGITDDVVEMIGSLLGAEQQAEFERIKARAQQLIEAVDWEQLQGREMVFAERMTLPGGVDGRLVHLGMPDMAWLFRGTEEGAAENYKGLVAILEALVEEINKATGASGLAVDTTARMGAEVACVNLLAMVPGAPNMSVCVALRGDIIVITFGEQIRKDVLGLLDGSGTKGALSESPQFRAAFTRLPAPEDSLTFFNMQNLLAPFRTLIDTVSTAVGKPHDVYRNTGMSIAASRVNTKALTAYRTGNYERAYELVQQAHDQAPQDSLILYNLACFGAVLDKKAEALDRLEEAVEAGFYAPGKIASDTDLKSLRDDPRFEVVLARATELAALNSAKDIVINSDKTGEAYQLATQALRAYEQKDYEQGLDLAEQAHAVAPDDSRLLYYLACFHSLLGHRDEALDRLEDAVAGGFYCPRHIARDPDLDNIRDTARYAAALASARENAARMSQRESTDRSATMLHISDRIMNAVGIMDYMAAVEYTEGYSAFTESVVALTPDAEERPFYAVIRNQTQLSDFDKFLPRETESFSVNGGIDLGELYTFLEDTVRSAGPEGSELLTKWAEVQEKLGIDVHEDFLSWLGGDFVSVTLADKGGSVLLLGVKDENLAQEKVTAAIERLTEALSTAAIESPMLAMLAVNTSPAGDERLPGFQNLHFALSPEPVVWGVADSYVIFGTSADAVALCLETAHGTHPGIRENERVMSEVLIPDGQFVGVTLTDQRKMGEEIASVVTMCASMGGMVSMAIPDPDARKVIMRLTGMMAKVGPVLRKIDFFKSTASHTTFDGSAWHTRAVTHCFTPEERASAE